MRKMEKNINHIFKIGHEIPGWQDEIDLVEYAKLAANVDEGGTIIEVGAGLGQTTFSLSENSHDSVKVYALDRWSGSQFNEHDSPFCYNCGPDIFNDLTTFKTYINNPKVETIQLTSPPKNWEIKADLIFIDVDHDEKSWLENIDFWIKHLKSNGTLAGNDYLCEDLERPPIREDFKRIKKILHQKAAENGKKVYNPLYSSVWFWY